MHGDAWYVIEIHVIYQIMYTPVYLYIRFNKDSRFNEYNADSVNTNEEKSK